MKKTGNIRAAKESVASRPKPPKLSHRNSQPAGLKIPPILLEGDNPVGPEAGGPGDRYVLGPTAPAERFAATELPEAYGTKHLSLVARDPHWLYANWDFTREQQKQFNALSSHGHLVLRVYADALGGKPAAQVHVHPESRHWFVHVGRGGTRYLAELGYHAHGGHWTTVASSNATVTPPDYIAISGAVEFATIPVDVSFQQIKQLVKSQAAGRGPVADAIRQLRATDHPDWPEAELFAIADWTPEQERALAAALSVDAARRVSIGSLEIHELLSGAMPGAEINPSKEIASPEGGWGGISSPLGGGQPQKGFWFNVNAELVIYGATEPDATVTIGGRPIKLRPDGSFSYRFALPDGQYELPVVAISADQTEGRAAELKFSRATENRGDVGAHPQDPALRPPTPGSV